MELKGSPPKLLNTTFDNNSEGSSDSMNILENEIIKLNKMKSEGLITEEEYLKLKSKIIEQY